MRLRADIVAMELVKRSRTVSVGSQRLAAVAFIRHPQHSNDLGKENRGSRVRELQDLVVIA